MRLALIVKAGTHAGKVIPITRLPFYFGRSAECQLRSASPLISQRHAALLIRDGRIYVRDMGSTNGTTVNGRVLRNEEAVVADGCVIEMGPLKFVVCLTQSTPGAGAPQRPAAQPPAAPPADATAEGPALGAGDTSVHPAAGPAQPAAAQGSSVPAKQVPPTKPKKDAASAAGELLQSFLREMKKEGSNDRPRRKKP
jgi:S-DNA-T family DNA segregation ATPase FtsK/SpoIIIE